ncbi:MAG: YkgJ family cysteine cluster protein [Longimicrobiales bacterium]
MKASLPVLYNCDRCPAYCCTYARIIVTPADIRRLARRFGITPERARERFTKRGDSDRERVLRHQQDTIFGTACRFLDVETRRCTVYEHRPSICREHPGGRRCGYYDFLKYERAMQDDPDLVVTAWVADV